MRPKQGDVVLVPIPFTDLSSQKRRPVIVVSNDAYNESAADVVVVAMTSNPRSVPYSIPIMPHDLGEGRLSRPGRVRVDKIYTLAQSILLRRFGRVRPEFLDSNLAMLSQLTARQP